MSHVTNVILTFDCLEDEIARMAEVNSADVAFEAPVQCYPDTHPELENKADAFIGGTHNTEVPIYIGAFNHMCIEEFLRHLCTDVEWEEPQNVRCYICDENDDAFEERFQAMWANVTGLSGVAVGDVLRIKGWHTEFKVLHIAGSSVVLREQRQGQLVGPELYKTTGDMIYLEKVPSFSSIAGDAEELSRQIAAGMMIPREYLEPSLSSISKVMTEYEAGEKRKNKALLEGVLTKIVDIPSPSRKFSSSDGTTYLGSEPKFIGNPPPDKKE